MKKFRSFLHSSKASSTAPIPKLLAETANNEEVTIVEADLYRYTRHRWLKNEQNELDKRYLKFSLPHLIEAAIEVCEGAQYCTKVLKCSEGLFNKAFILTMNNGAEIFAKLPNPNAGPAHYTTASEVATRKLLREIFHIPVPRVLSWSCHAESNPVQAEYILEEKASGVRLGSLWRALPWETKLAIVDQVAEYDKALTAMEFNAHGCIYFKNDLQRLTGRTEVTGLYSQQRDSNFNDYAIGPLTKAELWVSGRANLQMDRGPWQEPKPYPQSMGANEALWIRTHASPRMNYYRSSQEAPKEALELLAKYEQVVPFLAPEENTLAAMNVLWHPDLHLDNIFVDPATHTITATVDWQSACVAPMFYHSGVHRAFRHHKPVVQGWVVPEKPENFDTLSPDEQKRIDQDLESETIHKYYELQTMKRVPLHWDVLENPTVSSLRKPVWLVTGVWENQDLFFLRDSLIELVAKWNEMFGDEIRCPISFSTDELELHAKEAENMDGVGRMLSLFRDEGVLPADGMVQPEDYEIALENCRKYREVFLNAAQSKEEKEIFARIWPYDVC